MKTLVVYYSAEGHTRKIAEIISSTLGADIFEIVPDPIYTAEDLDWTSSDSRASRENDDESLRNVKIKNTEVPNWQDYDRVILGYPIWWGIAAWPVNSFIKSQNWNGKTIIPFCTSHSSGIGNSDLLLKADADGGSWQEGTRFFQDAMPAKIESWCKSL